MKKFSFSEQVENILKEKNQLEADSTTIPRSISLIEKIRENFSKHFMNDDRCDADDCYCRDNRLKIDTIIEVLDYVFNKFIKIRIRSSKHKKPDSSDLHN